MSGRGRASLVVGSKAGAPVGTEVAVPCGGGVTNAERLTWVAVRDEEQITVRSVGTSVL